MPLFRWHLILIATSPQGFSKGQGLASVGFKVADIDKAIAELQSRGVRLVGREKIGSGEYAVFHPKDTFGAMLSVIAYDEKDAATAFSSKK